MSSVASPGDEMPPNWVACADCKYIRKRNVAPLFNDPVLGADALKLRNEAQRELNERARAERDRVDARIPFDYEPWFFPWCEARTSREAIRVIDPVTGRRTKQYVLCMDGNADGQCSFFERASSAT